MFLWQFLHIPILSARSLHIRRGSTLISLSRSNIPLPLCILHGSDLKPLVKAYHTPQGWRRNMLRAEGESCYRLRPPGLPQLSPRPWQGRAWKNACLPERVKQPPAAQPQLHWNWGAAPGRSAPGSFCCSAAGSEGHCSSELPELKSVLLLLLLLLLSIVFYKQVLDSGHIMNIYNEYFPG